MGDLWKLVFQEAKLEDRDLIEVIHKEHIEYIGNSIQGAGHGFAMRNSSSDLSFRAKASESLNGMDQLEFLKKTSVKELDFEIREIHERITNSGKKLLVTIDEESQEIENWQNEVLGSGRIEEFESGLKLVENGLKKHYTLEGCQVNYVSFAIPVDDQEDYAALKIMTHLISAKFLHPIIRERGGAYGSGLAAPAFGSDLGTLRFFSYRDPANLDTLATFKQAVLWVLGERCSVAADIQAWGKEELKEAKLRAFQTVDSPLSLSQLGSAEVITNYDLESQTKYRNELLEISEEEVVRVAKKYLLPAMESAGGNYGTCIIGPKEYSLVSNDGWDMKDI